MDRKREGMSNHDVLTVRINSNVVFIMVKGLHVE